MLIRSRRDFLRDSIRSATALGAMSAFSRFGDLNAFAQQGQAGYQALVCVYLSGGHDGHNMIVPVSTGLQNYSLYQQSRQVLAIPQASLNLIANGNETYGLHPSLKEIQSLYNAGKAALLPNVGNLVQPIDRATYLSRNSAMVPSALFSHSDQSNQWQTGLPNSIASSGWGGRVADQVQGLNSAAVFPPIANVGTCGLFCSGQQTSSATVPPPSPGAKTATGMVTLDGIQNAPSTAAGFQQLLSFDNGLQLVQASNDILNRGNNYANTLTSMLQTSNISTVFPVGDLGNQLRTVANIMSVRSQLGLSRQIFFCQYNGFDTHSGQKASLQALYAHLSQSLLAFYQATQELGIDQQVTTFTASEFGRTLNPSGSDGSDHAWGNHHIVLGGAVKGGKMYGDFPLLALAGPNDANSRGTLIPTTSISQYGATLAQWFGVSPASMATVFPTIGNFATSNLGFLG